MFTRNNNDLNRLGTPIDHRFGRLVVLGFGPRVKKLWTILCRCDCGAEKAIPPRHLREGLTRSCGCLKLENPGMPPRHGMSNTPEHRAWKMMKNRCNNVNSQAWKHYGGRGITVCDLWQKSFEAFFEHVGPRPSSKHSLGRIDNDKGYEPGNVEWQTATQQANNQRPRSKYKTFRTRAPGTWTWRGRERQK